jgi:uncharacterized protein (DUF433 family)
MPDLNTPFLWSDPERPGGRICFRGTRVPVDALFENLEDGVSVGEFLEAFEGVTREQVDSTLSALLNGFSVQERQRRSGT